MEWMDVNSVVQDGREGPIWKYRIIKKIVSLILNYLKSKMKTDKNNPAMTRKMSWLFIFE